MEYKINKIDTERRKQINDASKEGIVHGYDNISIYKDSERNNNLENKASTNKHKQKRIFVNATKAEELEIDAFKEEEASEVNNKGSFLDVKR